MKKSIFQTVIFAIIFVTSIKRHTCKLFIYTLTCNDVQTKGNGKINTASHNYSKNSILILPCIEVEGLKTGNLLIPQLCFTIKLKNVK